MDIEQIISTATRPETTVGLCTRGDLQSAWEVLDREFDVADREITDEVTAGGSPSRAVKIAAEMEQIRQEIQASTVIFYMRGMSRTRWKELISENPPVPEVDEGEVNEEEFVVDMIAECCYEPKMTVDQARRLRDQLTDGQWQEIATAAWQLNKSMLGVPFSLAASTRLAVSATER